eukprot:GHVU01159745.1.p1 GENE.GHVU01159745.1~~GHVU01159745.1.p1  ORF type:complete len:105 (-),score=8.92 GHVU01159745.1:59-373(-)
MNGSPSTGGARMVTHRRAADPAPYCQLFTMPHTVGSSSSSPPSAVPAADSGQRRFFGVPENTEREYAANPFLQLLRSSSGTPSGFAVGRHTTACTAPRTVSDSQ